MNMKNSDLDFLQSELNRVNEFIRFADAKVAFCFTIYALLFGVWNSQLPNLQINSDAEKLFFGVTALCFLLGLVFVVLTAFPRLKNNYTDKSVFYFGNIASKKFVDFKKEFKKMSTEDAKEQILEQIYTNSIVANKKMKNTQKAIFFLAVLILFTIILLFKY